MKKWSQVSKITFVNTGVVIFIGIICGIFNKGDGFAFILGLICLGGAVINLLVGLVFFAVSLKDWGKGFLFSCCLLFLLSGISCGTGLVN